MTNSIKLHAANPARQSANQPLQFERLEARRVLDARFTLSPTHLTLDQWDPDTFQTLAISEGEQHFHFDLTNGSWQGTDESGLVGAGRARLFVSKDLLNSLQFGLQARQPDTADLFDTIFATVDLSQMTGPVITDSIGVWQVPGSSVAIRAAEFRAKVFLNQVGNDFGNVSVDGLNGESSTVQLTDKNSLVLQNTQTNGGDLSVFAGGDVVLHGDIQVGNMNIDAAGGLFDTDSTTLRVQGDATLEAATSINIGRPRTTGQPTHFRVNDRLLLKADGEIRFTGNSGRLNFQAGGNVVLVEESALILEGTNQTSQFTTLMADKSIVFQAANFSTNGLWTDSRYFLFSGSSQNFLNVASRATFNSRDGVYLAPQPVVHLGQITFDSDGAVVVSEDSGTTLAGENRAESLILESTGTIKEVGVVSTVLTGDLSLSASAINLARNSGSRLHADGRATLLSSSQILVGSNDLLTSSHSASVKFGQLNFNASGYVTINESDGMYLVGDIHAARFDLRTQGLLLNGTGVELTVDGIASFYSSQGIVLGKNSSDRFVIGGLGYFRGGPLIVIDKPGYFVSADINSVADQVIFHSDVGGIEQINQALPNGWSNQLFSDGENVWSQTFDADGNEAFRFRFGTTGVISSIVDSRNGQELVAPTYEGEITDRVVQWVLWEVGQTVRYDVPELLEYEDRFNLTQAGTVDNRLSKTVEVNLSDGQLDVWAVNDQQWRPELQVHIQGSASALTRYTMLDGGAMLVRRIVRVGDITMNGESVQLHNPILVGWFPWAETAFDTMALSVNSLGQPDLAYRHKIDLPSHQNQPIAETRGWAMVYDRDNLSQAPTMAVVFGREHGDVHLPDGTTVEMRRMLFNSLDFEQGIAFNPALWTASFPAGSIIDQSYIIVPGQGIRTNTGSMLDALSSALPEPQVYHPGAPRGSEIQAISNRLQDLASEPYYQTDQLGELD